MSQDDVTPEETTEAEPSEQRSVAAAPVKRKRRWLRRLGFVFLLIILLVAALPYLFSTQFGTRTVVGWVNGTLPGKVGIEQLSLCWVRSCSLQGAMVKDPQGREVLHVASLSTQGGLLKMLTGSLGDLTLHAPQVVLYADENGRYSLADAFGPPSAQVSEKPSEVPKISGRIVIDGGSVRIVHPDGGQMDVSQINLDCRLDATNDINGTLSFQTPDNGQVQGELKLRNLAPQGTLQPLHATGTIQLATGNDLPIATLAAFALGQPYATGKIALKLDAAIERDGIKADLTTRLIGVQSLHAQGQTGTPIDAQLTASVIGLNDTLTAQVKVESSAANGQLTAIYPLAEQPPLPSTDAILSAILGGQTNVVPKGSIDGSGQVDLVKLARAVPALLDLRQDVEVMGGTLQIEKLAIRGGTEPSASGKLSLAGLSTRVAGNTAQWQPVTLAVESTVAPGRGVQIQQAAFDSEFAKINATGNASDLKATFQTDLSALHRQISQIFDIGSAEMAGAVAGTAGLKRTSDTHMDLAFAANGDKLRYRMGANQAQIDKVTVRKNGHVTMDGSSVKEIVITDAEINADNKILATGTGSVGVASGVYQSEVNVKQADLAYLGNLLKTWGAISGGTYTGNATAQMKIHRTASAAPFISDGSIVLQSATVDGTPLSSDDVKLGWNDLSVDPEVGQLKLAGAQLASSIAHLQASNINCRLAAPYSFAGAAQGDADLAKLLPIVSRISGRETPPAIVGRMSFNGQGESSGDAIKITSQCTIDDFAVGSGDQVIRDKKVQLTLNSTLDAKRDALDLSQLQLESQLLTLKASGGVTELSSVRRLDVRGEYAGSWDAITALIHELSPGSSETIAFSGSTGSKFEITGPTSSPKNAASGGSVPLGLQTSGIGVNWASAKLAGLDLKQATFSPTLRQGIVSIPVVAIPALTGQAHLGGDIDLRQATPVYLLRDKTAIIDNITITPELGRQLLSRVNPMFGQASKIEGSVSLILQGVELPLGDEVLHHCAGQGRLDLKNMKMEPAGLLAEALSLLQPDVQKMFTVTVEGIDFVLKDGRLSYENCALKFGDELDLRFHGSIGFDDTVDLLMSTPVRAKLLERFGVLSGVANDYMRLLADARIEIPISGTRGHPKLDLAKVDMKPLIDRAARDLAAGALTNLLGGGGPDQPKEQPPPAPSPPTQQRENRASPPPAPQPQRTKSPPPQRQAAPPAPKPASQPAAKKEEPKQPDRPVLRALQERQKQRQKAASKPASPATQPNK